MLAADPNFKRNMTIHQDIEKMLISGTRRTRRQALFKVLLVSFFFFHSFIEVHIPYNPPFKVYNSMVSSIFTVGKIFYEETKHFVCVSNVLNYSVLKVY